jgi:hypothetical protein
MFDWLFESFSQLAIGLVNALILALGSVLAALFALLPDLPALPEVPAALILAESWVAWVFPVGTLLDILVWTLTVWLIWQGVAIALRWAKALGDA